MLLSSKLSSNSRQSNERVFEITENPENLAFHHHIRVSYERNETRARDSRFHVHVSFSNRLSSVPRQCSSSQVSPWYVGTVAVCWWALSPCTCTVCSCWVQCSS